MVMGIHRCPWPAHTHTLTSGVKRETAALREQPVPPDTQMGGWAQTAPLLWGEGGEGLMRQWLSSKIDKSSSAVCLCVVRWLWVRWLAEVHHRESGLTLPID